jgi:hypothetical protein
MDGRFFGGRGIRAVPYDVALYGRKIYTALP